jgi:hypothetical protein
MSSAPDAHRTSHDRLMEAFADLNRQLEQRQILADKADAQNSATR